MQRVVDTARHTALDAGHITAIGVGVIIALVVIGFLIGLVITAIIGRVLIALVVVVLAIVVWSQRTSIEHKIDQRKCNLTFFGVHLDPPEAITGQCAGRAAGG